MSVLLMSLLAAMQPAAAAEPFDLTRLDDLQDWEDRSRVMLKGPPGCIEVQGTVRIQFSFYSPGGLLSAGGRHDAVALGQFEGRLDEGVWTRLETRWADTPADSFAYVELDRFRPIVGRIPKRADPDAAAKAFQADIEARYSKEEIEAVLPASDDSPGSVIFTEKDDRVGIHIDGGGHKSMGLLYDIIQGIDPDGTATYVTWDEQAQAVRLTESVPLSDKESFAIEVEFPKGEEPTRLDVVFPKRHRIDDEIGVVMRDAQLHLRSQSTALGTVPGVEGASARFTLLGLTLGFDQRVAYQRVRECAGK